MTKDMFINELRRALAVGLSSAEIEVHVKYYNEYIAMEFSKGKLEEKILDELGDPRLISKSILEAKEGGEKQSQAEQKAETRSEKLSKIPRGLFIILVIIVIIALIALLFRVFIQLLPILLIGVVVIFIVSFVRKLI